MSTLIEFTIIDDSAQGPGRVLDDLSFTTHPANITAPEAELLRPKLSYAIRTLAQLDDRCEDTLRIARREKTR